MNFKKISIYFTFRNAAVSTVFIMTVIFYSLAVFYFFESRRLSEEYYLLNDNLMSYSYFADINKMKRFSDFSVAQHSEESINDALIALFSGHFSEFEMSELTHDSILVSIENADFNLLLDVFLALSKDVGIEVSHVDISFIKDSNHINSNIILLKKL
ncbi:hypothetical protein AB8989_15415 [Yersinia hibernica]|uniref:Uncharacterized protein n=1 Tax=Yersinia hibernica TaxID=2339259 RepID=A0ABX5R418_9GAMM|nr:hypothetical protein [Yersinia hibernica]QAX80174.1 hypothetical protein D5F51_17480 [Yersinia hibernica]